MAGEDRRDEVLMGQPHEPGRGEPPGDVPLEESGGKALADALKVSFRFLKFAMIVLVAIYLLRGIFYVKADEVKVKVRFGRPVEVAGKYVMDSESGWHIRWPWEEVRRIPVDEQVMNLDKEFWHFAPAMAEQMPILPTLNVKRDGYLLTGDVNIVHMKLRVRYQARSDELGALDYLFRIEDPEALLRRFVIESVIKVVGREAVMDVLSEKKGTIKNSFIKEVQDKLVQFETDNGFTTGVRLVSVDYAMDPAVPLAVRAAFDEAQQAADEKSEMIRQAEEEQKRIPQQALEVKAKVLGEAEAYGRRLQVLAEADADAVQKLLAAYDSSPAMAAILRDRHYNRMVEKLLGEATDTFVLHSPEEGNRGQIRILLSRQPKMVRIPEQAAPEAIRR